MNESENGNEKLVRLGFLCYLTVAYSFCLWWFLYPPWFRLILLHLEKASLDWVWRVCEYSGF